MRNKITFFFFLCFISAFSQNKEDDLYANLSTFSSLTTDSTTINEIVQNFKNGAFNKVKNPKIYKRLENKTWWYHFELNKEITKNYFTIASSYLSYGKIYLKKGNEITELHKVSYFKDFPHKNIFYRHPVWKIPLDSLQKIEVFLELKNNRGRTRLELHLETENEFLNRVETEHLYFGLFIAFLISMIIILGYFSVLKKEYSVLFYAVYIITTLFEFLAGNGLGIQYFWSESPFMIDNTRDFSQTLGVCFMGLFYLNFYKFSKTQLFSKNVFRWTSYATIPLLLIYLYKFFYGNFINYHLFVWPVLKTIILIWIINHAYLAFKKQIPLYLVWAFVLPIVAVIIGQVTNPDVSSRFVKFSGPNLYYLALPIEILLFTRYIFGSVIRSQKKYFQLKKASDELRYSFQTKTLEIQTQERNKLVSNVHDSFGGYLEALKLRLLQKSENTPEKIQEILDSFYKEYRYLLNSLHSPKINSENFVENLIDFFKKLNQLTNNSIKHQFSIESVKLSQEKCVHLYHVISELTTNAIKYSTASEIEIKIYQESKDQITLIVSDNGIGFDELLVSKKGFGLNNIKTRVEQMNGSIKINSTKNIGTIVTIYIPKND